MLSFPGSHEFKYLDEQFRREISHLVGIYMACRGDDLISGYLGFEVICHWAMACKTCHSVLQLE